VGEKPIKPFESKKSGIVLIVSSLLVFGQAKALTLAWDGVTNVPVAGYCVYRGTSTRAYATTNNVGSATQMSVAGLIVGATYFFAVTSYNSTGQQSDYSSELSYTVPSPPPPTPVPPAPWQTASIGNLGANGSVAVSNGVYSVTSAGNISGTADNFNFLYQALSGDGEIKAKIMSIQSPGTAARTGVMIREALTSNSKNVFMGISSASAYRWQRRISTGGNTSSATSGIGILPNIWVRLVRTGNSLTGYKSANGSNWTQVSSRTISMATNIYIGLAMASGSSSNLNFSTFSGVSVVP